MEQNKKQKAKNLRANIHCGIFGNRQGMKIETDGPFTHCFDIIIEEKNKNKNSNKKKDKAQNKKKVNNDNNTSDDKTIKESNTSVLSDKIEQIIDLVQKM